MSEPSENKFPVDDLVVKLEEVLEGQRRMNRRLKDVLAEQQKQPAVIWGWMQLREWTKSVDRKLALIIGALQALVVSDDVIPELEQAVNRSLALSRQIDLKVEDEQQEKG